MIILAQVTKRMLKYLGRMKRTRVLTLTVIYVRTFVTATRNAL